MHLHVAICLHIILEAHHFGLSVGLKNDVGQIHELQPYFDWALNESCLDYDECNDYSPFIKAHKVYNQKQTITCVPK